MRIGMVSYHHCIRVFKESLALLKAGHQVEAFAIGNTFGWDKYDAFYIYATPEQLVKSIQSSTADIFHVHNEPDWIVAVTKENAGDRPVVYDIHDLESLRWQKEPDEHELAAFAAADGIVHVSQACKDAAVKYHGNDKPSIILHPYVNQEFYGYLQNVSWSSIVYEGGLTAIPITTEKGELNYRNYQEVIRPFLDQGFGAYLFGAGPKRSDDIVYEELGAFVARDVWYPALMQALRGFGFGLVGTSEPNRLMNAAMPNKLFEYMAAGVVPVCYNAESADKFCQEYGIGIHLESLENIGAQLKDGPEIRKQLLQVRDQFTMEAHIYELENLYQQLLSPTRVASAPSAGPPLELPIEQGVTYDRD